MKSAFANEALRVRMLDACFSAVRANESLAASGKLFPTSQIGMGDMDPKMAVKLYTGAVEKSLEALISMLDDETDAKEMIDSAKGVAND